MYVTADETGIAGAREEEILHLGLGSFYGSMHRLSSTPAGRVLRIPYAEAAFEAAFAQVAAACDGLLLGLAPLLDEAHGTRFGRAYWEHLLSFWLLHYLANVQDKIFRLKSLDRLVGPGHTVVANGSLPPLLRDPMDFFTRLELNTDGVNGLFLGLVAEQLGMPVRFSTGKAQAPASEPPAQGLPPQAPDFTGLPGRSLPLLLPSWHTGPAVAEALRGLGFSVHLTPHVAAPAPGAEHPLRPALGRLPARGELEAAAVALLPVFFPALYLESHAAMRALSSGFVTPGVFLNISSTSAVDPLFLFASAESRALCGAVIAFQQQGGGDGTNQRFLCEYSGRRTADAYVTWGWSDEHYPGAELLPAPQLAPPRPGPQRDGGALFVSTSGSPNQSRINPWATAEGFVDYFLLQQDFYAALRPEAARGMTYRPYPSDRYKWASVEAFQARFPETPVSFEGSLQELLGRARLAVIDHNSTSFLEALMLGTPLVCYWPEWFQPLRASCREDYDALRRAGVLFSSPEQAAAKVNAVWDDPVAWWASAEVRRAVEPFSRKYAWTDPEAPRLWLELARKLLDRAQRAARGGAHAQ